MVQIYSDISLVHNVASKYIEIFVYFHFMIFAHHWLLVGSWMNAGAVEGYSSSWLSFREAARKTEADEAEWTKLENDVKTPITNGKLPDTLPAPLPEPGILLLFLSQESWPSSWSSSPRRSSCYAAEDPWPGQVLQAWWQGGGGEVQKGRRRGEVPQEPGGGRGKVSQGRRRGEKEEGEGRAASTPSKPPSSLPAPLSPGETNYVGGILMSIKIWVATDIIVRVWGHTEQSLFSLCDGIFWLKKYRHYTINIFVKFINSKQQLKVFFLTFFFTFFLLFFLSQKLLLFG